MPTGPQRILVGSILALAGAGLIALSVQAAAHPTGPVAHIAVGAPATTIIATTTTTLSPAAPTTIQDLPAPVATTIPAGAAAAVGTAAATPTAPQSVATVPLLGGVSLSPVTGSHTITAPGLWLMARDGSGLRRLLVDRPDTVAWSPDDTHLALARNGAVDVFNVADGSTNHLLTFAGPTRVASLAWSPSGLAIAANVMHNPYAPAAQGGPSSELMVVDAVKGTTTSVGRIGGAHPSWSAKGCLGWVFSTVDVWCPGGPLLSLPPMPGSDLFAWSPDGTRYAITSSDDAAPGAIRTYAANGSGALDLANVGVYPLAWAGDGRSIVFESNHDLPGHLWAQPISGGPASVLANLSGPYAVNGVDDGVMLSIGRGPGSPSIVSFRVSDPAPHQLVTVGASTGGIGSLNWARDGRWLVADAKPLAPG